MSNIRDVAKEAGVSTATVSRTFTTPHQNHTKSQRKVVEAARRLGYSPRPVPQYSAAREPTGVTDFGFRSSVPDIIGFQFFGAGSGDSISGNAFYGPILIGAEKAAASLGLHMLVNTIDRHASEPEVPTMAKEKMIGGMLLVGGAEARFLSTISEYVPNLVLVDNSDESLAFEAIVSDSFGGAYEATQYLLDLGHRDEIAFLLPGRKGKTFQTRLRGYVCALFENGVALNSDKVVRLPIDDADGTRQNEAIKACLLSPRRPTAIVCANDYYALKVMQVCWSLGLRIPDDISVIGFDDIEFSSHMCPPLTTVHVDKERMGQLAVHRLYARLRQGIGVTASEPVNRHTIPVKLIARGSCAPPRKEV